LKWKEFEIPGLSHQPMHYILTKNDSLPFKLIFRARPEKGAAERKLLIDKWKSMLAFCYPKRGAVNITDAGPPRILVVWPRLLSMTCVLKKFKTTFKKFNADGEPLFWEVDMSFRAIRDVRITGDEVEAQGLQRSPGSTANTQVDAITGGGGNSSGSKPPPVSNTNIGFQPGRSPAQL
jgi:hypothetical protein